MKTCVLSWCNDPYYATAGELDLCVEHFDQVKDVAVVENKENLESHYPEGGYWFYAFRDYPYAEICFRRNAVMGRITQDSRWLRSTDNLTETLTEEERAFITLLQGAFDLL